jgi:hypothetical protein
MWGEFKKIKLPYGLKTWRFCRNSLPDDRAREFPDWGGCAGEWVLSGASDGEGFKWAIEYDSSSKMVDWVEARNPSPTDGVSQSQNCWRYLLFYAGHLSLAIVFV